MTTDVSGAAPSPRILAAAELPAVRTFIATQNLFGAAAPPFSAEGIRAAMAQLDALSAAWPQLSNAAFKGWATQLYDLLQKVPTSFGGECFPAPYLAYKVATFPFEPAVEFVPLHDDGGGMFLGWHHREFNGMGPNNSSIPMKVKVTAVKAGDKTHPVREHGVFPAFAKEKTHLIYHVHKGGNESDREGKAERARATLAGSPPGWHEALEALVAKWDVTPPPGIFPSHDFDDYETKLYAVLDPKSWTDVENVKSGVAGVWKSQATAVRELLDPPALTREDYFFLLHVLLGLVSGDPATQALAHDLSRAPAGSTEYPNDIFINQLLHLVLMHLADPEGAYGWNSGQLQQFIRDLSAVTLKNDSAAAISDALGRQEKILNSAAGYPMGDPYNPAIGFVQRITDTLFALDKARAAQREKEKR